ncbi:YigZ family protein [Geopsychrobacter electrodiphilus]|uniref:YigZ family protein n=1 Tax=Geopsychrobacter electrodiphilus TaxID=225196 RepID=UPI0003611B01|nr:YigZ family protein [Geopsychrobacter electrodiphilus]
MSSPAPRYPIAAQRSRCEIEVERSRFIATLQEVCSAEDAQAFVAELKAEFPDASHNCWAYLVGPPGSSDRIGLSDDGEPHGVAGRPLLTCLQHSGLGDIAVVVTRYFGGIKLGKGGMVKAYTLAVQTALDQLPRAERVDWCELRVTFDYALVTPLERRLMEFEAEPLATDYAEKVSFRLRLPRERAEEFRQIFEDLTAGQGSLRVL